MVETTHTERDAEYEKRRDALMSVWHPRDYIMPAPDDDAKWNMLCDDLLLVENKPDMRLRARLWACAILDTTARQSRVRRSAFLKSVWKKGKFQSSLRRLFSISMTGTECARNPRGDLQ